MSSHLEAFQVFEDVAGEEVSVLRNGLGTLEVGVQGGLVVGRVVEVGHDGAAALEPGLGGGRAVAERAADQVPGQHQPEPLRLLHQLAQHVRCTHAPQTFSTKSGSFGFPINTW